MKTKQEANYRKAAPDGQRCGTCSMFRSGSCTLVSGRIEAAFVCDYWEPKKHAEMAGPLEFDRPANLLRLMGWPDA